jgi:protein-export membrane protein SecD
MLLVAAAAVGYFVYSTQSHTGSRFAFKLGLDLNGGTHLVYKADTSRVSGSDVSGAMTALRDVIERRVNLFGVSEPLVQVEQSGVFGQGGEERLIVELPGVTDITKAIEMIGKTPLLDFRLVRDEVKDFTKEQLAAKTADEIFLPTGLTGRYVKKSELIFDQTTGEPKVLLHLNSDGANLFSKITKDNIGKILAIFLDGAPISTPVVRQEITDGNAEISGNFKIDEAKKLVRDLNYGALPVPVNLISTQTIGASLGGEATKAGFRAGIFAFIIVAGFLILWYRLPGLLAAMALLVYVALNLAIFKLIPVTLTAAGIAGFILSIGMAVDANVLIFERMKEELRRGRTLEDAMKEGFARAWLSIRDSNLSSIISAIILYSFASTSVIKGFALVFFIGVVTSMFTAITATRTLLLAMRLSDGKLSRFLFSCGIR